MGIPVVSILVPYRDASKTLKKSLDSLLNQTFKNIEVLLINDGSTDGSENSIIPTYDERIIKINLAPSGIVTSLNEGLYSCRGKFIAFTDPHDISDPSRIELQVNYLNHNTETDVVSAMVKYFPVDAMNTIQPYIDWSNSVVHEDDIYLKRFSNCPVIYSSVLMRKDLISKFGSFKEGDFPEDYEMWLRFLHKGAKFYKMQTELVEWHDDLLRLSRRHIKYNPDSVNKLKAKYFSLWFFEYFNHPPSVLIWNTGDGLSGTVKAIENEGIEIAGFIDMKETGNHWINNKPVFYYRDLPANIFILFTTEISIHSDISQFLDNSGYEAGRDFLFF